MLDKQLKQLIQKEIERQKTTINLIASENYATPDILEVLGTPLVNKYSEGYPGKRYYSGNEYYDKVEKLAQKRALKAFKLKTENWSVNVQPYSGSPANFAIYLALINVGDTLMGMSLISGGHLTHGHKVNFSGKLFKTVQYGINPQTGLINYDEVEKLAIKYRPEIIVSGASAYPRKIDFKRFGEISEKIGAYHVADISHIAGLIVAGLHPSPFLYADVVMTTTHKTLRGPRGAVIFVKRKVKSEKWQEICDLVDRAVFPGVQGGPHNNITAAKALTFLNASKSGFKKYQKQVVKNAKILAEALKKFGFKLLTDGTDNHLIMVDLKNFNLDGLTAEKRLEKSGITTNRNTLIGDKSPFKPSGLRLGTPAITTRGMKEKEMKKIAELIYQCLIEKEDVGKKVQKLCKKFPLEYWVYKS
jgi:glycine hydroxymethyltransferase